MLSPPAPGAEKRGSPVLALELASDRGDIAAAETWIARIDRSGSAGPDEIGAVAQVERQREPVAIPAIEAVRRRGEQVVADRRDQPDRRRLGERTDADGLRLRPARAVSGVRTRRGEDRDRDQRTTRLPGHGIGT